MGVSHQVKRVTRVTTEIPHIFSTKSFGELDNQLRRKLAKRGMVGGFENARNEENHSKDRKKQVEEDTANTFTFFRR